MTIELSLLLHTPQQGFQVLFSGHDNPIIALSRGGSGLHLTMVPWAHPNQSKNGISIGSAVFAGLTNVTNRH